METVPLCVGEGRYVPESWGLHLQLVLLHLVQAGDDHARQGKQRNDVGQDDQVIEHVGKLPDEVAAGDGAQEDEHQRDDSIDDAAQLAVLAAEQIVGVDLAEQVPAEDGGEGEEQQADGHKLGAQAGTKYGAKGGLGQVGLAQGGGDVAGVAAGQRAILGVQALRVSTTKVSMNTPIMATTP